MTTTQQFIVIQTDDDVPMGEVFSGTLEECERFVRLRWDLLTMSGNPVEIDFVIEEAPHEPCSALAETSLSKPPRRTTC